MKYILEIGGLFCHLSRMKWRMQPIGIYLNLQPVSPSRRWVLLYVEGLIVWDHLSGYFRMHGSVSLPPACPCQGGHAIRQILDYACNLLKINA